MNILFLTLVTIKTIDDHGIYEDLLRKFVNEGHHVSIVNPTERRSKVATNLESSDKVNILRVKTFNIQKTNIFEKGIGTLAIEYQFLNAIKKYLSYITFDLILYSTPPITFTNVIEYIKQRDNAYSYLLLKDIFPQNAVDMKMLKNDSMIHRYFLKKERRLYQISDTIGCMSEANQTFVIRHNPEIDTKKVEVNPNSIEPIHVNYTEEDKIHIRDTYHLPLNKKILVYGGNLGKPQGLDFLLETIKGNQNSNAYFLIVGDGTEYARLNNWFNTNKPDNAMLLKGLSKLDYNKLLAACDVGLIFLHKDFLIPNFPSRLLSYLEMRKPVIAATDVNTDIGDVIEKNKCGYKVIACDIDAMSGVIDNVVNQVDLDQLGNNGWSLLHRDYLVDKSYQLIEEKLQCLAQESCFC